MREFTFDLHDVSEFPIIRSHATAARPGYAPQWEREMEALVAKAKPFVIIFEGERTDETQEDRKQRGIWLKHNKSRLGAICKALISIEESELKRIAVKAQSAMAAKAFGIPMIVVGSGFEAREVAREFLGLIG
ncbi:hypothetical protein GCM10022253_20290 [Sphingomonas endophytica]|uniref:Uncharacterized protein n=1 Tax=Sphingomonas endophytica TaxID=869719 RepID=A0ABR6N390_9SPHN|nr:hypothetical protein [Sphingomonas endophytica]MBB5724675.1 hypothetical protein [Sphingomonas endophytica]